tara:strand:+ start:23608 stop:24813 length:1206 start_codon:yes stop_codon:yes gene_type:complete
LIRFLSKYNPNNAQVVLLIILAIFIPSGFYNVEGIIISLLFVNWLLFIKGCKTISNIPVGTVLLSLFFVMYLVGFFITDSINLQLEATTKHLAYFFSLIGIEPSKNQLDNIKKGFIWATLLSVLFAFGYAFFDYLITGKSTVYVKSSVQSKFYYYGLTRVFRDWHPTYVSLFYNLSFIFVYNIYIENKKYIIAGVFVIILFISIFLLNSFIGILSAAGIVFLYFISSIRGGEEWSLYLFLSDCCFHFNPFKLSKIDKFKSTKISVVDTKEERNILNLRLVKWQTSYDLFKTAPSLGVSADDYREKMVELYKKDGFSYAADKRFSSHNQYLNILSSFGIVGFILFLTIIIYPLRFGGEMSLFLLIFSLFCLTEDILLRQQGLVFFCFFYSLLQLKSGAEHEI